MLMENLSSHIRSRHDCCRACVYVSVCASMHVCACVFESVCLCSCILVCLGVTVCVMAETTWWWRRCGDGDDMVVVTTWWWWLCVAAKNMCKRGSANASRIFCWIAGVIRSTLRTHTGGTASRVRLNPVTAVSCALPKHGEVCIVRGEIVWVQGEGTGTWVHDDGRYDCVCTRMHPKICPRWLTGTIIPIKFMSFTF